MSELALGNPVHFGLVLCKILGLDPSMTGEVQIILKPREPPVALVTKFLTKAEQGQLEEFIQEYSLTEKTPASE